MATQRLREGSSVLGMGRLSPRSWSWAPVVSAGRSWGSLFAINAEEPTYEILGVLDDGPVRVDLLERIGTTHIGDTVRLVDLQADYVIAIGAAAPRRPDRCACHRRRHTSTSLLDPAATIGRDVIINDGVIVAAGARLTTHIVVGRHSHINLNSTIGHDAVIGDFVTVFGGVHVGGGAIIDDGATLESGSVILPNVRIGADATVGAGAVVVRDVAPGSTVVGTAARPTLGATRDRGSTDQTPDSLGIEDVR